LLAAIAWFGLAFGLWFKGGTGIAFGMTGGYAVKVLEGLKSSAVQQRVAAALIVNSSAGFIAMIFIVGGLCGLMHPKESDRIELVAERVQHFHSLLYLSVGLTLTGLWMIFGLFHWAAALAGAAETKNAIVIADSVVLLAGMFYSVILVITFIPASIALQGMIDKAFRVRLTEPNPPKYSEWREAVGLSDIPLASVRTYLSLGAPMVSGLFAAFVKNLVA
jgi:hypothetical protein